MTSGSVSILHVDNESSYLDLIKIHLEKENPDLQVESIISPSVALKKLRTREYDIIITGYQMSEMTGLELLITRETVATDTSDNAAISSNVGFDFSLDIFNKSFQVQWKFSKFFHNLYPDDSIKNRVF